MTTLARWCSIVGFGCVLLFTLIIFASGTGGYVLGVIIVISLPSLLFGSIGLSGGLTAASHPTRSGLLQGIACVPFWLATLIAMNNTSSRTMNLVDVLYFVGTTVPALCFSLGCYSSFATHTARTPH